VVICGTALGSLNGARGMCESVRKKSGKCKAELGDSRLAQETAFTPAYVRALPPGAGAAGKAALYP
jgi:hypothetical protein